MPFYVLIGLWQVQGAAAAPAPEPLYQLSIQRQALDAALRELARQTGLQIARLVDTTGTGEVVVGPVTGELSIEQALQTLLQSSGLAYRRVNESTIAIVPSDPALASGIPNKKPASPLESQAFNPIASGSLAEVVVTALRRSERLQDAQASVSAIDQEDLRNMGASDYRTYLSTLPSVSYADNGTRFSRIVIRGVSPGILPTTLSTVGIYIDDAPVTEVTSRTLDPNLFDVERVEVLRGPQGTLYGSSSQGGTIRVILNKPILNTWEGAFEGSGGSVSEGGTSYKADGVVNVPLVEDRLAARVSGGYDRKAGFIDNVGLGEKDVNRITRRSARVALHLALDDSTSVAASVLYQNEDIGSASYEDLGFPHYTSNRFYPEVASNEAWLYSLTLTHEADWMSAVVATNYLRKDSVATVDTTGNFRELLSMMTGVAVPINRGLGDADTSHYTAFTEEVRLTSSTDRKLQWLLGGFYSQLESNFGQLFDLSRVPELAILSDEDVFVSNIRDKRRQFAGFGELTYNLTERFSVTAGLRSSNNRQDGQERSDGLLNGGSNAATNRSSSSVLTKKFQANFELTSENLLYATAADGFRDGGGIALSNSCAADLALYGLTSFPTEFDPDTLWSYELGSKNTFLDRRVTFNAAAYYIDWKDLQSTAVLPTCLDQTVLNAGQARIRGFEIETAMRPMRGLTIGASMGYTDAKLEHLSNEAPAFRDNRLPLVPKRTFSLNAQREFSLSAALSGFARVDYTWTDERWTDYSGNPQSRLLPSYSGLNARVGISRGKWDVGLYGTNLLNEHVVANIPLGAFKYNVILEPRVIGLYARVEL